MSGEHDAASVAGSMAGLGGEAPPEQVDPAKLIERFCGDEARGLAADPGTTERADGVKVSRGWCGYSGNGSHDPIEAGFDEGYDFMGTLRERGWKEMSAKGDWPYVVYMQWLGRPGEFVIAEYCEADLTIWVFPSAESMRTHYEGLKDCP
jgi:hypothetical protein